MPAPLKWSCSWLPVRGGSFYLDGALLYEVTALVDSPGLLLCEKQCVLVVCQWLPERSQLFSPQ